MGVSGWEGVGVGGSWCKCVGVGGRRWGVG